MELPQQLQEDPVLIPWGNLFLQVIAKEIHEEELPVDKDERDAYPWTKAKKWSLHNLNRLFSRYRQPLYLRLMEDTLFKRAWEIAKPLHSANISS